MSLYRPSRRRKEETAMPVYESTYRAWDGKRTIMLERLMAFPRYCYLQQKNARTISLFFFSWAPLVLFLAYVYISVNPKLLLSLDIPNTTILPDIDARFFRNFLYAQQPFVLIFTMILGPPLISSDLGNQALPMILSKPISRWEYILGKSLTLVIILSLLTWIQSLILFAIQMAVAAPDSPWMIDFWSKNVWILPSMILYSFMLIATFILLVLSLSAMAGNFRIAGATFLMTLLGSVGAASLLNKIFGMPLFLLLSPVICMQLIIDQLLIGKTWSGLPAWSFFLAPVILWMICLFYLSRKIRGFHYCKG